VQQVLRALKVLPVIKVLLVRPEKMELLDQPEPRVQQVSKVLKVPQAKVV
jgi:hypothetical protein